MGTASVRAALVNHKGQIVHTAVEPIEIHNPQPDFYEQSSQNIWSAVCSTVKQVLAKDQVFILHTLFQTIIFVQKFKLRKNLHIEVNLIFLIQSNLTRFLI